MRTFLKMFFASLLAFIVFGLVFFFFVVAYIGGLASKELPKVSAQSVLVIDLAQHFSEQKQRNPFGVLSQSSDVPGLYEVIRAIRHASQDERIKGIYVIANANSNEFAASEELRSALATFKSSGKFLFAHGNTMTQGAYAVAQVADSVFLNPQGVFDWSGFSVEYAFLKGTLEKLEIEPQIFYAGKFKSATEPFRTDKMTPENRLQTSVWLDDLYAQFLLRTAEARKVDTATLHALANDAAIRRAADAVTHKLIDGVRYDDEVKDIIKAKLKIGKYERIPFITISTYVESMGFGMGNGENKVAVIFAEGNIVDGKAGRGVIGGDDYRNLIRKARLDQSVKAIVLRVNSGGGSGLASDVIWREMTLAKSEKPVVVSFGDVAASGGYYIACAADSIFAMPSTITGSIGVFGIIPNMESFFKNKLGVTFDGVQTGPFAGTGTVSKPLNERERQLVQESVENFYTVFKERVASGRKRDTAYIDSIAQGRVWTGYRALGIGLIDRHGGIQDAIDCAARMAKLTEYRVKGYPEPENIFQQIFGTEDPMNYQDKLKAEMGEEQYRLYQEIKNVREITGSIQARMPFYFRVR